MSDRITEFLPMIRTHVLKNYAWMRHRDCLLDPNDLIQLASIVLMKLDREWDEIVRTHHIRGGLGMFWMMLEERVRNELYNHIRSLAPPEREQAKSLEGAAEAAGEAWSNDDKIRRYVRAREDSIIWGLVRDRIVDYYSLMQKRTKVLMALRHFDELTLQQVGDIMGMHLGATNAAIVHATGMLRRAALAELSLNPTDAPERPHNRKWEPPDTLLEYLRSRHQMDIDEYIGVTTIAFRVDGHYLQAILTKQKTLSPGTYRGTLSPYLQQQADDLLRSGVSMRQTAQRLGVGVKVIQTHAKRRRAA